MMVGSMFKGDIWVRVMLIQHDYYMQQVFHIFDAARSVYLQAERVLGVNTVPGLLAVEETSVDHRVLQDLHDLIAAHFRYVEEREFHPQLPFAGQEDDTLRIKSLWVRWYHQEIRRLAQIPEYARAVVVAVAFENTEVGREGERVARGILLNQYPELRQPSRV